MGNQKKYSYTAIDQFDKCPYAFKFKYVDGLYSFEESLATSLGSLLHKAKELCSQAILNGEKPNYDEIKAGVLVDGFHEENPPSGSKPDEDLLPVEFLKTEYASDWNTPDEKSGLSYEEKLDIFFSHLKDDEEDEEWHTIGAEIPFMFEIRPNIFFRGYIDKVQENDKGDLRIVDYKSSKKVYDKSRLSTPLQLYIYYLACQELYPDRKVVECIYDFILLGEKQKGGSSGWLKRAEKKLDAILDNIEKAEDDGMWKPSPSPLCYWCPYCTNNPNASEELSNKCRYYSNWTPSRKVYSVNEEFDESSFKKNEAVHKAAEEFRW